MNSSDLKNCADDKSSIPCILGKGSFGIVILEREKNKKYALKRLLNEKHKKVFQKQYENLLNLKERGICEKFICLFGTSDKPDQIKMEYLHDYVELFDYVTDENIKTNSIVNKKIISESLLNGLNELHRNGFIHSDLKLENIMVKYDKNQDMIKDVRIIDFGGMIVKHKQNKLKPKYSINIFTFIFNTKQSYSFQELVDHDRFCLGICLSLLIGYKNKEFLDIYSKFVNYGFVYSNIPFSSLNIFEQLNIIFNYYLNIQEKVFKESDASLFTEDFSHYSKIDKKVIKNSDVKVFEESIKKKVPHKKFFELAVIPYKYIPKFKWKLLDNILNKYDDSIFKYKKKIYFKSIPQIIFNSKKKLSIKKSTLKF